MFEAKAIWVTGQAWGEKTHSARFWILLHVDAKKEATHVVNVQPRNTFCRHIPNVACGVLVPITDNS